MKRILAAASLALLLGACQSYPQDDIYYPNAPYPPYPADPYPPPAPYPPAPYPPTSYPPAYPAPPLQPGICEGITSRDWRAWVSQGAGTDARPTLFLTGTVVAPTVGYRIEFRPDLDEDDNYPVEVTATLQPFPPVGTAAQVQTTHDLRWQWPLDKGPVGSVQIECGNRLLAEIPVARTP